MMREKLFQYHSYVLCRNIALCQIGRAEVKTGRNSLPAVLPDNKVYKVKGWLPKDNSLTGSQPFQLLLIIFRFRLPSLFSAAVTVIVISICHFLIPVINPFIRRLTFFHVVN